MGGEHQPNAGLEPAAPAPENYDSQEQGAGVTPENAGETMAQAAELTPENAALLAEYGIHLQRSPLTGHSPRTYLGAVRAYLTWLQQAETERRPAERPGRQGLGRPRLPLVSGDGGEAGHGHGEQAPRRPAGLLRLARPRPAPGRQVPPGAPPRTQGARRPGEAPLPAGRGGVAERPGPGRRPAAAVRRPCGSPLLRVRLSLRLQFLLCFPAGLGLAVAQLRAVLLLRASLELAVQRSFGGTPGQLASRPPLPRCLCVISSV